jgi:hypothetical protein
MKKNLIITVLLIILSFNYTLAQEPESYFPSHVGDLWQYYGAVSLWQDWNILRDSVANDGYRYLYINFPNYNQQFWWYRIDSAFSVYRFNGTNRWGDTLYHLSADSGDIWLRGPGGYAWVYDKYQGVIFGKTETIKVIRSGPVHPDSGGNEWYFTEQYLASGFGVIYHKEEPYGELILKGCIINSDTFGVITTLEKIIYNIPESFILNQNYPNPFNPYTTISYSIPEKGFVEITIFNMLGEEIKKLIAEEKPAGSYNVSFNGSCLTSGIYFYRLKSVKYSCTRKMILLK